MRSTARSAFRSPNLQRYTNLSVAVDIAGNIGQCGDFQPVTLKIDGATTIDSSPADPPDPAGFQSIPQALMPKVQVGIEPESFDDTARAVSIMEGLQRLSGSRIDTEVVPLASAIDSDSPGHADLGRRLGQRQSGSAGAQFDGRDDSKSQRIGGGSPATLTLDPATPFASLQVGRSGNRTVLFATSEECAGATRFTARLA